MILLIVLLGYTITFQSWCNKLLYKLITDGISTKFPTASLVYRSQYIIRL